MGKNKKRTKNPQSNQQKKKKDDSGGGMDNNNSNNNNNNSGKKFTPEAIRQMKMPQLKELRDELGLKTRGKERKPALCNRIIQHYNNIATSTKGKPEIINWNNLQEYEIMQSNFPKLGLSFRNEEGLEKCIENANIVLKKVPQEETEIVGNCLFSRAICHLMTNDTAKGSHALEVAESFFESVRIENPEDQNDLFDTWQMYKSRCLYLLAKYEESFDIADAITNKSPTNWHSWYFCAACFTMDQKYDKAIEIYKKALMISGMQQTGRRFLNKGLDETKQLRPPLANERLMTTYLEIKSNNRWERNIILECIKPPFGVNIYDFGTPSGPYEGCVSGELKSTWGNHRGNFEGCIAYTEATNIKTLEQFATAASKFQNQGAKAFVIVLPSKTFPRSYYQYTKDLFTFSGGEEFKIHDWAIILSRGSSSWIFEEIKIPVFIFRNYNCNIFRTRKNSMVSLSISRRQKNNEKLYDEGTQVGLPFLSTKLDNLLKNFESPLQKNNVKQFEQLLANRSAWQFDRINKKPFEILQNYIKTADFIHFTAFAIQIGEAQLVTTNKQGITDVAKDFIEKLFQHFVYSQELSELNIFSNGELNILLTFLKDLLQKNQKLLRILEIPELLCIQKVYAKLDPDAHKSSLQLLTQCKIDKTSVSSVIQKLELAFPQVLSNLPPMDFKIILEACAENCSNVSNLKRVLSIGLKDEEDYKIKLLGQHLIRLIKDNNSISGITMLYKSFKSEFEEDKIPIFSKIVNNYILQQNHPSFMLNWLNCLPFKDLHVPTIPDIFQWIKTPTANFKLTNYMELFDKICTLANDSDENREKASFESLLTSYVSNAGLQQFEDVILCIKGKSKPLQKYIDSTITIVKNSVFLGNTYLEKADSVKELCNFLNYKIFAADIDDPNLSRIIDVIVEMLIERIDHRNLGDNVCNFFGLVDRTISPFKASLWIRFAIQIEKKTKPCNIFSDNISVLKWAENWICMNVEKSLLNSWILLASKIEEKRIDKKSVVVEKLKVLRSKCNNLFKSKVISQVKYKDLKEVYFSSLRETWEVLEKNLFPERNRSLWLAEVELKLNLWNTECKYIRSQQTFLTRVQIFIPKILSKIEEEIKFRETVTEMKNLNVIVLINRANKIRELIKLFDNANIHGFFEHFAVKVGSLANEQSVLFSYFMDKEKRKEPWSSVEEFVGSVKAVHKQLKTFMRLGDANSRVDFKEMQEIADELDREFRSPKIELTLLATFFANGKDGSFNLEKVVFDHQTVIDLCALRRPLKLLCLGNKDDDAILKLFGFACASDSTKDPDFLELIEVTNSLCDPQNIKKWTISTCKEKLQAIVQQICPDNSGTNKTNEVFGVLRLFESLSKAKKVFEFVDSHKTDYARSDGFSAQFASKVEDFLSQLGGEDYKIMDNFKNVVQWVSVLVFHREEKSFSQLMQHIWNCNHIKTQLEKNRSERSFSQLESAEKYMGFLSDTFKKGVGGLDAVLDIFETIALSCTYIFDLKNGELMLEYADDRKQQLVNLDHEEVLDLELRLGFIQYEEKAQKYDINKHLQKLQGFRRSLTFMQNLRALGHEKWQSSAMYMFHNVDQVTLTWKFPENVLDSFGKTCTEKELDNLEKELSDFKEKIDTVRRGSNCLYYFSNPATQKMYEHMSATPPQSYEFALMIAPFLKRSATAFAAAKALCEKCFRRESGAGAIAQSGNNDWPEKINDILSTILQKLMEEGHIMTPLLTSKDSNVIPENNGPIRYIAYNNNSHATLLKLLLKITNKIAPKPYEIMWCHKDTTENMLKNFLSRAERSLNRRPFILLQAEKLSPLLQHMILQLFLDSRNLPANGQRVGSNIRCVETGQCILQSASWIENHKAETICKNTKLKKDVKEWVFEGTCIHKCIECYQGPASSGKTYQLRKSLNSLRESSDGDYLTSTVSITEAFSFSEIIKKLHKNAVNADREGKMLAVCFHINLGKFKQSERTEWKILMERISKFFISLLVFRSVEDPLSGSVFNVEPGNDLRIFVEIPDRSGHLDDGNNIAIANLEVELPVLWACGTFQNAEEKQFDIDEDTKYVCKYLKAYDDGTIDDLYGSGEVGVMFSFDTTGSMTSYIDSVKTHLKEITQHLFDKIPNLRVGIIAHGDYCDKHKSYVIKHQDFTRDYSEIENFLKECYATGGGDAPECYELALRDARKMFSRNDLSVKSFVLIGDDVPHEPSYPGNTDKIDWRKELKKLNEMKVTCFGVQCGNRGVAADNFYKRIAADTSGKRLRLSNFESMPAIFVGICLKQADPSGNLLKEYESKLKSAGKMNKEKQNAFLALGLTVSQKIEKSGESITTLQCIRLLRKYMKLDKENRQWATNRLKQRHWIRYLFRRCGILACSEKFNKNKTMEKFGSTTMEIMLSGVEHALSEKNQFNWNSVNHEQFVYYKTDIGETVDYKWSVLATSPDDNNREWTDRRGLLKKLGMHVPTIDDLKRPDRRVLDSYLAHGLGISPEDIKPLKSSVGCNFDFEIGTLPIIDSNNFVLTTDFVMKMLRMNERIECGVPCILEGETGVSKTAITRMLFILKNITSINRSQSSELESNIRESIGIYRNTKNDDLNLENAILRRLADFWSIGDINKATKQDSSKLLKKICKEKHDKIKRDLLVEIKTDGGLDPLEPSGLNLIDINLAKPIHTAKVLKWYIQKCIINQVRSLNWTFHPVDVHAALTPDQIENDPVFGINRVIERARRMKILAEYLDSEAYRNTRFCIFFDEINTSSCMGFFKELLIDHTLNGIMLPDNISFVAACNPFRGKIEFVEDKRREELGNEWAGGHYQVHPLCKSLKQMSWDYGSLKPDLEFVFIQKRMVYLHKQHDFKRNEMKTYADLVYQAQQITREFANEHIRKLIKKKRGDNADISDEDVEGRASSSVSLRDLLRVFKLFNFFLSSKSKEVNSIFLPGCTTPRRKREMAILVAIGLVYYLRLGVDNDIKLNFRRKFQLRFNSIFDKIKVDIETKLLTCMDALIEQTHLEPGIAKTRGLKENVFMVVVCCLSQVPLMIVGPPGSSKTLAVTVVEQNARGKYSMKPFYKGIPKLQPFRYQCSRRSTSNEIKAVFDLAIERQDKSNKGGGNIRYFVFMDEAGLPEEERESLKVLHYYLENHMSKTAQVGFVAITNHQLDAAKSNRCLLLTRAKPDIEELMNIARGCLGNEEQQMNLISTVKKQNGDRISVDDVLKELCTTYDRCMSIKDEENASTVKNTEVDPPIYFDTFFGLRDFMHFVQLLGRKSLEDNTVSTEKIMRALYRSMNGVDDEKLKQLLKFFMHPFYLLKRVKPFAVLSNPLDLMQLSMIEQDASKIPIGRYKLVIDTTKDDSILHALKRMSDFSNSRDSSGTKILKLSHFPEDSGVQEVNAISQVKWSVEKGETVILSQTENINESFYDLFNQNFHKFEDKTEGKVEVSYHTNIAVGAHSRRCRVSPRFQCIVHLSDDELKLAPAPFLNRFEKYRLTHKHFLDFHIHHRELPAAKAMEELLRKPNFVRHIQNFVRLLGVESFYGFVSSQTIESALLCVISGWKCTREVTEAIAKSLKKDASLWYSVKSELADTSLSLANNIYNACISEMTNPYNEIDRILENPTDMNEFAVGKTLLYHYMIRQLIRHLLKVAIPERVLRLHQYLPKDLLRTYLSEQSNFNLRSLLNSSPRMQKYIIYTRTSAEILMLQTGGDAGIAQSFPKCSFMSFSHFTREPELVEAIDNFLGSEDLKLIIVVDSTQTSNSQMNFLRHMIDEKLVKSRKSIALLLHVPTTNLFVHSVYHTTISADWTSIFLDNNLNMASSEENMQWLHLATDLRMPTNWNPISLAKYWIGDSLEAISRLIEIPTDMLDLIEDTIDPIEKRLRLLKLLFETKLSGNNSNDDISPKTKKRRLDKINANKAILSNLQIDTTTTTIQTENEEERVQRKRKETTIRKLKDETLQLEQATTEYQVIYILEPQNVQNLVGEGTIQDLFLSVYDKKVWNKKGDDGKYLTDYRVLKDYVQTKARKPTSGGIIEALTAEVRVIFTKFLAHMVCATLKDLNKEILINIRDKNSSDTVPLCNFIIECAQAIEIPPLGDLVCPLSRQKIAVPIYGLSCASFPFFSKISNIINEVARKANRKYEDDDDEEDDVWVKITENMVQQLADKRNNPMAAVIHNTLLSEDIPPKLLECYMEAFVDRLVVEDCQQRELLTKILTTYFCSHEGYSDNQKYKIAALHSIAEYERSLLESLVGSVKPLAQLTEHSEIEGKLLKIVQDIGGDEDEISEVLNNAMVGFFYDHMLCEIEIDRTVDTMHQWAKVFDESKWNTITFKKTLPIDFKKVEIMSIVQEVIHSFCSNDTLKNIRCMIQNMEDWRLANVSNEQCGFANLWDCIIRCNVINDKDEGILMNTPQKIVKKRQQEETDGDKKQRKLVQESSDIYTKHFPKFAVTVLQKCTKLWSAHLNNDTDANCLLNVVEECFDLSIEQRSSLFEILLTGDSNEVDKTLKIVANGSIVSLLEHFHSLKHCPKIEEHLQIERYIPYWLQGNFTDKLSLSDCYFHFIWKWVLGHMDDTLVEIANLLQLVESKKNILPAKQSAIVLSGLRIIMLDHLAKRIVDSNYTGDLLTKDNDEFDLVMDQLDSMMSQDQQIWELEIAIAIKNVNGETCLLEYTKENDGNSNITLKKWLNGARNLLENGNLADKQLPVIGMYKSHLEMFDKQRSVPKIWSPFILAFIKHRHFLRYLWVLPDLIEFYEWVTNELCKNTIEESIVKEITMQKFIDDSRKATDENGSPVGNKYRKLWTRVKVGINMYSKHATREMIGIISDKNSLWSIVSTANTEKDDENITCDCIYRVIKSMTTRYRRFLKDAKKTKRNLKSGSINSQSIDLLSEIKCLEMQASLDIDNLTLNKQAELLEKKLQLRINNLDLFGILAKYVAWNYSVEDKFVRSVSNYEINRVELSLRTIEPPKRKFCKFTGTKRTEKLSEHVKLQQSQLQALYHSLDYQGLQEILGALVPIIEYTETQDYKEPHSGENNIKSALKQMFPDAEEEKYNTQAYVDITNDEHRHDFLGTPVAELQTLDNFLKKQIENESYRFHYKSLEFKVSWDNMVEEKLNDFAGSGYSKLSDQSRQLERCLIENERKIVSDQSLLSCLSKVFKNENDLLKKIPLLQKLKDIAKQCSNFQFLGGHYVKLRQKLQTWTKDTSLVSNNEPIGQWNWALPRVEDISLDSIITTADATFNDLKPWFLTDSPDIDSIAREAEEKASSHRHRRISATIIIQYKFRKWVKRKSRAKMIGSANGGKNQSQRGKRGKRGKRGRGKKNRGRQSQFNGNSTDFIKSVQDTVLADRKKRKKEQQFQQSELSCELAKLCEKGELGEVKNIIENRKFLKDIGINAKDLINKRLEVNNNTVLMKAAQYEHVDVVKYLLEHDADSCIKNSNGCNVLHVVAKFCKANVNTLELLLKEYMTSVVHINSVDKNTPQSTPLDCAYNDNNSLIKGEIIKVLRKYGGRRNAEKNVSEEKFNELLFFDAIKREDIEQLKEVLANDSKVASKLTTEGQNCLHFAATHTKNSLTIMRFLLQANFVPSGYINQVVNKSTPLDLAYLNTTRSMKSNIVKLLRSKGAKANTRDKKGARVGDGKGDLHDEVFPKLKDHPQELFDKILSCINRDFLNAIKQYCKLEVKTNRVAKGDSNLQGQVTSHSSKCTVDDALGLTINTANEPTRVILRATNEDGNIIIDFGVVMHELGHAFDFTLFKITGRSSTNVTSLSQRNDVKKICSKEKSHFKRAYFHDEAEFLAEVFSRFSLDPLRAEKKFPQMTKVFKQELKKLPNMHNYDFTRPIVDAEKLGRVLDEMVPHPLVDVYNMDKENEILNLEQSVRNKEKYNDELSKIGGEGKGHRQPYIICIVTEDKDVARLCGRYIAHRLFRHRVQNMKSLYWYEEAFLEKNHGDDIKKDLEERLDHHGFVLFLSADQGANIPSIAMTRYLERAKTHEDLCIPCVYGDYDQVEKFQRSLIDINADVNFIKCKANSMNPEQVARLVLKIAKGENFLLSNFAEKAIIEGVKNENITHAEAVKFWLKIKTCQQKRVEDAMKEKMDVGDEEEHGEVHVQISITDVKKVLDERKRNRKKTPMERLDDMVGLKNAKESLKNILSGLDLIEDYKFAGLDPPPQPRLNILFLGNPGTGKTRFADTFRDILVEKKIVNDKYKKLSPNDSEILDVETLFSNYKNGVIFIDEFHQMHLKDELKEALKAMVPYLDAPEHTGTVFIAAGYPKQMLAMINDEKVDPGLPSRFNTELRIELGDFTKDELGKILDINVKNSKWPPLKSSIREQALETILRRQKWEQRPSNGRGVVKFFESARSKQQKRLAIARKNGAPRHDKTTLTSFILEDVESEPPRITLEQFWKETNEKFSGNKALLQKLKDIQNDIEDRRKRGITEKNPYNFFLKGPPGVGKTTIAREIIGKFFCALDIIPGFELAPDPEKGGKGAELQASYVGQSAAKVKAVFDEGFGKTIFIDEISGYFKSGFQKEITKTIVSYIEDYPEKFIFVAADYTENFNKMISLDSGLSRRFNYVIDVPRWDADLSTTVFLSMMNLSYKRDLHQWKDYILKCMQPLTETWHEDETGASYGFSSGGTCNTLAINVNRVLSQRNSNMTTKQAVAKEFQEEHQRLVTIVASQSGLPPPAPSIGTPQMAFQEQTQSQDNNKKKSHKVALPKLAKELNLDDFRGKDLLITLANPELTDEERKRIEKELKEKMKNEEEKRKLEKLLKAEELRKWQEAERKRLEEEEKERKRKEQERLARMAEEARLKEIEKEKIAQEALRKIGSCCAGYRWIKGNYSGGRCDHCFGPVAEGYNCSAGGHFVCMECVDRYLQ